MEEENQDDIFHSPKSQNDDGDENKLLSLFRTSIPKQDPSCKEIDDATLRRFLRARDLNVEKARTMLMKYLTWQKTFVPKGFITTSEIPNQIAQNKMFMQGKDRQGCLIAVVFGARHFPCKGGLDEFKRYLVFALDKLCSTTPEGQEKFTIIGDLQGYGYCNCDVRGTLAAISILQDYYPERLGKVFMVHVPYIFTAVWKIVCPFIDAKIRKKIKFVEHKKECETLTEEIEESQLPEIYGGKMQLVPIHYS